MKLKLNGKEKNVEVNTLNDLISKLKMDKSLLYIQINGEFVKKDRYKNRLLKENDNIEIISAVGGG